MGKGKIQYREAEIEQMIETLRRSAKELRDSAQVMNGVARTIDQGALLGRAGEEFTQAVSSTLSSSIERLAQELDRQARYVQRELDQLKRAAASSKD